MSFGIYSPDKQAPIPTFFQYIKTASKGIVGKTKFAVDIIWLPGSFDNVTLQTHAFRYICTDSHPLYTDVIGYFEGIDLTDEHGQMTIIIASLEEKTIEVTFDQKKMGFYQPIGAKGMRFKVKN